MTQRILCGQLYVDQQLYDFIQNNALPGTGLDAHSFWQGFSDLVHDLAQKTKRYYKNATNCKAK